MVRPPKYVPETQSPCPAAKSIQKKKYTTQPGWLHNESSFENVRLKWVLEELKTVYNVNIISENIDVDLRYTGSFTNTDLDSALQTITLPMRLEYAIENNNVILTPKE